MRYTAICWPWFSFGCVSKPSKVAVKCGLPRPFNCKLIFTACFPETCETKPDKSTLVLSPLRRIVWALPPLIETRSSALLSCSPEEVRCALIAASAIPCAPSPYQGRCAISDCSSSSIAEWVGSTFSAVINSNACNSTGELHQDELASCTCGFLRREISRRSFAIAKLSKLCSVNAVYAAAAGDKRSRMRCMLLANPKSTLSEKLNAYNKMARVNGICLPLADRAFNKF